MRRLAQTAPLVSDAVARDGGFRPWHVGAHVRDVDRHVVVLARRPPQEAPKSVGSNGETVFRLKGNRGRRLDVQPSMSVTLTPRILVLPCSWTDDETTVGNSSSIRLNTPQKAGHLTFARILSYSASTQILPTRTEFVWMHTGVSARCVSARGAAAGSSSLTRARRPSGPRRRAPSSGQRRRRPEPACRRPQRRACPRCGAAERAPGLRRDRP